MQDLTGQRGHIDASIALTCTEQGSCRHAKGMRCPADAPDGESETECLGVFCGTRPGQSQLSATLQAITLAVHSLKKNMKGSLTLQALIAVQVKVSRWQALTNDIKGLLVEL